ncbi:MAG: hypothetical protein NVS3B12_03470 [Acidimicrobiales bacterium]
MAMVLGAAVRLEQFGARRSLWLDEALVANNVVARDFAGLLRPLNGEQGAPVGWLWVQRVAVIVLGNTEYALRVVPLLAGLTALVLIHRLAMRIAGPVPASIAVWLLALSPAAVRYSVEVKQYSSDLVLTLLLTLLALRVVDHDRLVGRRLALWSAAGVVAVWCAHPAVLVLAASTVVLWVQALYRRDRRDRRRVVCACVPWIASFGLVWIVSLRQLGHDSFLRSYWAAGLAPRPLQVGTFVPWLGHDLLHLMDEPGRFAVAPLAAALVVGGLLVATRRRPLTGALLATPMVAAVVAATVGGFPLRGRVALWLLPLLLVGIASSAALCPTAARNRAIRIVGYVVLTAGVGGVAAAPAADVITLARDPSVWSDIRPLLQDIHRRAAPDDLVWVHEPDLPAATYYATAVGTAPSHVLRDSVAADGCQGESDLAGAAGGHRVWFVYGYRLSTAARDERGALVGRLSARAKLVGQVIRPDATAWLFDFATPGETPPGTAPPGKDALGCVKVTTAPAIRPSGLTGGPLGTGRPT